MEMTKFAFQEKYILPFFLLVAVAMRFFSFFPSVLDHDESTYLVIGRDILNGKALYADVTDTKPVGIFLFYAGLEFLFGQSIFLKRLVFSLIVGATGFLVHRVSIKLFSQSRVAFASGLIYIFYTSIWTYHGRSPNTELLFNFTTICALLLFLKQDLRSYIAAGLFMGTGFIIKYLVLFDMVAFLLFFFILEFKDWKNKNTGTILLRYFLAGIAFLVPFGLTNLYFWTGEHFKEFYFITYELPGNYGRNPSVTGYVVMLLEFIARFLPFSFMLFYVLFKNGQLLQSNYKWFFTLWAMCILVAIYLPGKGFSHYTIQLMLPLSLLAGLFFHPNCKTDQYTQLVFSKKYGLVLLVLFLMIVQVVSFRNEVLKTDYEEEVAEYIAPRLKKGDVVYVSNYKQIIYYLLGIDSPTKFVHSSLLFSSTHKAFQVDANKEIKRVIDNDPKFILMKDKNDLVRKEVRKNYFLLKTFRNNRIFLYRRKD